MSDVVPVYAINLERARERRSYISYLMRALGMSSRIWTATDGRELTDAQLQSACDQEAMRRDYRRAASVAEIACYLSHMAVLEDVANSGVPWALVLEDDIILHPDTAVLLDRVDLLRSDWDIVSLGSSAPSCGITLLGRRWLFGPFKAGRPTGMMWGSGAYLVSAGGAARLLRAATPMRMPYDAVQMGCDDRTQHRLRLIHPSLAFYPSMVDSELEPQRQEMTALSPLSDADFIAQASCWRGRVLEMLFGARGRERLITMHRRGRRQVIEALYGTRGGERLLTTLRRWRGQLRRPRSP